MIWLNWAQFYGLGICFQVWRISQAFTLNWIWLSESRGPSSSTTVPDWSPDISCIVASRECLTATSPGCRTLASESKALVVKHESLKRFPHLHCNKKYRTQFAAQSNSYAHRTANRFKLQTTGRFWMPHYSMRHLAHRVISLAVCSSPCMSVMELSPLLNVSTPIRSLPPSLASLLLLRCAREDTTLARVPRSPCEGCSCE